MSIEQTTIQTIRTLSMDAVQKANSGHPGAPLGMAPLAYTLWGYHLKFNPRNPYWPNRDRFVLSAGHASMLLYALLHLTRTRDPYRSDDPEHLSVTLDDIRAFRQLGSRCPGHPEFGVTAGVETTTGPLGQGLAVSVGMALAERHLEARYNTDDMPIVNYNVYALCGDGCMMEGVSHEAAALAGHLKLSNLCWIYDSNRITIEGSTDLAMSEDVARRFIAYGWAVIRVLDGNDLKTLQQAFEDARAIDDRPVLIIVNTHIAYGSPNKQDSEAAHGAPLGEEEVRLTKKAYGADPDAVFTVSEDVYKHMEHVMGERNTIAEAAWNELFTEYKTLYPGKAKELDHIFNGTLPENWSTSLPAFTPGHGDMATRAASGTVLNAIADSIPWLMGGSADLGPSNKSLLKDNPDFSPAAYTGRNLRFGVREFAMSAICNGMTNAGLRPYAATFLVFSDYARPALRLSALMQLPVLYIYTHDSISVGEDGPTHQPVEHLASLRSIPGMTVIRPADAAEVVEAYRYALTDAEGPVVLSLSRQKLPVLDRTIFAPADGLHRGAYILADNAGDALPDIIIIATGSEVRHALDAYEHLTGSADASQPVTNPLRIRVVSMPSWEIFDAQTAEYRDTVLPPAVRQRIVMEQGVSTGWHRYAGDAGTLLTIDSFGASAPGSAVEAHFGFTAQHLVDTIRSLAAEPGSAGTS